MPDALAAGARHTFDRKSIGDEEKFAWLEVRKFKDPEDAELLRVFESVQSKRILGLEGELVLSFVAVYKDEEECVPRYECEDFVARFVHARLIEKLIVSRQVPRDFDLQLNQKERQIAEIFERFPGKDKNGQDKKIWWYCALRPNFGSPDGRFFRLSGLDVSTRIVVNPLDRVRAESCLSIAKC